jgi:curved DNA-binding protein CbpA
MDRRPPEWQDPAGGDEFKSLFSLRKPRDARAGFASGAKSLAKGFIAGTVGLVAAPVIGASQEGFLGFAKGAAAGIAGAVVLPVAGIAVGLTQAARGVAAAGPAARGRAAGQVWDARAGAWVAPPGTALVLDPAADEALAPLRAARAAADGDLYALLGVPRSADAAAIKRAYYLAARRLHPDKNPRDPAAGARFQALARAYQVLGSPELRARYDAHGAEGLDVNYVDGAEFFAALFGSDRFEHLVGELALAAAAGRAGREGGGGSAGAAGAAAAAEAARGAQREREARLEANLAALLERHVAGDAAGFAADMTREAADLARASYGDVMLRAIGRCYEAQAAAARGGVDGGLAALRARGRTVRAQFRAAGLALKVYQAQTAIGRLEAEAALKARAAREGLLRQQAEARGEAKEAEAEAEGRGEGGAAGAAGAVSAAEPAAPAAELSPPGPTPAALAAEAAAAAAARQELEEASLPLMLEAMWAANAMDIESTLRHVCRRVLTDPAASRDQRRARVDALAELGRIFLAASAVEAGGPSARSAKEQMEAALVHVMERRVAGEVDGEARAPGARAPAAAAAAPAPPPR